MITLFETHPLRTISTLSPRPYCFYDDALNKHLCFWGGLLISHKTGMSIMSTMWLKVYPTNRMKEEIFKEFRLMNFSAMHGLGLLQSTAPFPWTAARHWGYCYEHIIGKVSLDYISRVSPAEAFNWFNIYAPENTHG